MKKSQIFREVSLIEYQESTGLQESEWSKTEKATTVLEEVRCEELALELIKRQRSRLDISDPSNKGRSTRQALIQLFTTSKMGLPIGTAISGKRKRSDQDKFHDALIVLANKRHPDPLLAKEFFWCPITSLYWSSMKAANIFPYASGATLMQELFQTDESEMFSVHNGMMMSAVAEERLDRGCIVLVPDVSDQTDVEQMKNWYLSSPREYKIRVVARESELMNLKVKEGNDTVWLELDNKRVEFRSAHRPRARYLNYLYLITMLRRSWNPKLVAPADALKDDLGKPWWATRTRRMRSSELLQAIIEEGGLNYSALESASDEEGEKRKGTMEKEKAKKEGQDDLERDLVLGTANAAISASVRRKKGVVEDSESESEDESA